MAWRAAYCESRRELFARDNLRAAGFDVFCPFERLIQRRRRVASNRYLVEAVDAPVFPRYLFVETDDIHGAEQARGVISIVNVNGSPLTVKPAAIFKMRAMADEDGLVTSTDLTRPSVSFRGVVGDRFSFRPSHTMFGHSALIKSLARLDSHGVIEATIEMLGAEREISVPVQAVGNIVPDGGSGPRVAASVG